MTFAPPRRVQKKQREFQNLYKQALTKATREEARNRMLKNRIAMIFEEYGKVKDQLEKANDIIREYAQAMASKKTKK
jgi:hypothetical protein